jgi:hypothetical protein
MQLNPRDIIKVRFGPLWAETCEVVHALTRDGELRYQVSWPVNSTYKFFSEIEPNQIIKKEIKMGTRNLTQVILNGETKISQYCQWDGYPSGQGEKVLQFLLLNDIAELKTKVAAVQDLTDEEIKVLNASQGEWLNTHPHLSRDVGPKILDYVMHKGVTKVVRDMLFAADSLFCEWAYVIDLDNEVLEVYKGFNKTPLAEGERFYSLKKKEYVSDDSEYYPIKLYRKFKFSELTQTTMAELEQEMIEAYKIEESKNGDKA